VLQLTCPPRDRTSSYPDGRKAGRLTMADMTDSRKKLVAIGELLVDFVPGEPGISVRQAESFQRAAGGAPANAAAAAALLGAEASFIGRVGADAFGAYLRDTLAGFGVDTSGVVTDPERATTLAFVSLAADADRDFVFYRDGTADTRLEPADLPDSLIRSAAVLHFCSISLSREPARGTTFEAVRRAAAAGALISFDLNWRAPLWSGTSEALPLLRRAAAEAHILKLSEEELELLTGSAGTSAAAELLGGRTQVVLVSRGARGLSLFSGNRQTDVPAFPVTPVDTTGAGDALAGAFLGQLAEGTARPGDHSGLVAAARRAAAAAALSTRKPGAMPSYPSLAELEAFLDAES